jgi:hypothetical protein
MDHGVDPFWYVNRCALDATIIDRVAWLLDSTEPPSALTIMELSALAESYVLHDGLVVVGQDGLALSSDAVKAIWSRSAIKALGTRGGFDDSAAERYTEAVLNSAGISFDEFHPNLNSLQAAWDEEEEEMEEELACRDALDLDDYDLRIKAAVRESMDAADDEDYGIPDYEYTNPDDEDERRRRRAAIPSLDQAASQMGLSIVQSPVDSLHSLANRIHVPVTVDLYSKLADYYRVSVAQLLRFQGIRQAYIPPILAIALHRCRTRRRADIPELLNDLREELAEFRQACATLQRALLTESTLAKQFAICEELDSVQAAFIRTVGKAHGRFVYQTWDIVKKGTVLGILTAGVDKLLERDKDATIRQRWQAFFNLWNSATIVESHAKLIRRVFGADVHDGALLVELAVRTAPLENALRREVIE